MRRIAVPALVVLGLVPAAAAHASAGPVIGIEGLRGVVAQDGSSRYVTLHGSRGDTVVAQLALPGGEVTRERGVRGSYMIPAVSYDGIGGGLSADGTTLVLIEQTFRFPVRRTRMVVLDAQRLSTERRIGLRGHFGFDAISPDGTRLYLTQYLSQNDPTRYAVRAYDIPGERLDKPIVDPREPDEKMTGYPITRTMSPAGRWAYTLYDSGGGEHPFIHALDTLRGRAFCVDVDSLAGRTDLWQLHLRTRDGGGTLAVMDGAKPVALVDTKTMDVSSPAAHPRAHAPAPTPTGGEHRPWMLSALLAVVLLAATALPAARSARRPRRRRA